MHFSSFLSGLMALAPSLDARTRVPSLNLQEQNSTQPLPMHAVENEPHNYVFSELQPQTFGGEFYKQPYFRFLILFKRKEGITEEWFHQYWSSVHADMTMAMKGTGMRLLRYVQFHQDRAHKEQVASMLTDGMALAPYDGIAEFHAKDIVHLKKFFDTAWADHDLNEDMLSFINSSVFHVMAGYDNLVYGTFLETSGGRDGIMPSDSRLRGE